MQTRQLFATVTATSTGVTYIELPTKARVKAIQLSIVAANAGTAGDIIQVEVSLNSSNQTATNDAIGILAGLSHAIGAAGVLGISDYVLTDVELRAGERLYLNSTESGTSTWYVRAIVHYV